MAMAKPRHLAAELAVSIVKVHKEAPALLAVAFKELPYNIKELLKKCIGIARKEKCWRIRLETGLSRKRAQRFYKMMEMKPFALAFMLSL